MEPVPITSDPPGPGARRSDDEWRGIAKGMMKAELKRQNLTYDDLAKRLNSMGLEESEASVRNKVSRGTFSFVFALQAFEAIGVQLIAYRPTHTMHVQFPGLPQEPSGG
jgi:hypothetical protein